MQASTFHQHALRASAFRKLGLSREIDTPTGFKASQILNVLGPGSFARFEVIRCPGRVIWVNFDLARELGFKVPRTNQMTPQFHEQLLSALSFRVPTAKGDQRIEETITMYADRYGGDGVAPGLGAGRAGFYLGNLYVKGVGHPHSLSTTTRTTLSTLMAVSTWLIA